MWVRLAFLFFSFSCVCMFTVCAVSVMCIYSIHSPAPTMWRAHRRMSGVLCERRFVTSTGARLVHTYLEFYSKFIDSFHCLKLSTFFVLWARNYAETPARHTRSPVPVSSTSQSCDFSLIFGVCHCADFSVFLYPSVIFLGSHGQTDLLLKAVWRAWDVLPKFMWAPFRFSGTNSTLYSGFLHYLWMISSKPTSSL